MWVIRQVIVFLTGIAGGMATAAGVFALITVIGMIPRMAGVTRTGHRVRIYETAIALGGGIGNLVDLYNFPLPFGIMGLSLFGICCGIFVGCLVMSLAEIVDVFPIIIRRCRIKVGFWTIIVAMALGKMIGLFLLYGKHLFS